MTSYIALLRKDADSDIGVDFPDFPGCITAGATMEEARHMAQEALALHIDGLIQDKAPVPPPSPLDAIMADPANRNAVAFLVDIPVHRTYALSALLKDTTLEDYRVSVIDWGPDVGREVVD
jgi:predicted RNase H-like HicB family nuclease